MSSLKAIKVINELVANSGSLASAVRKAGYSPRTARNPKKLTGTKAYQEAINPFVESLKAQRQTALDQMDKTIDKASYSDLVNAIDKLTKNINLMSGFKSPETRGSIIYLPQKMYSIKD